MSVGIFNAAIFSSAVFNTGVTVPVVTGGGGGERGGVAFVRRGEQDYRGPAPLPRTVSSAGTAISVRFVARGAGIVVHHEIQRLVVASAGTPITARFVLIGHGTVDVDEEADELAILGLL